MTDNVVHDLFLVRNMFFALPKCSRTATNRQDEGQLNEITSETDRRGMKRFLIFPAFFPPLTLVVFTAPDGFKNLLDWMVMAYAIAVIPALLLAWVDWALSAKPLRVLRTAVTAALAAVLIVRFMSGGSDEFWPLLMVGLVGGLPAAVCSWLSDKSLRRSARV